MLTYTGRPISLALTAKSRSLMEKKSFSIHMHGDAWSCPYPSRLTTLLMSVSRPVGTLVAHQALIHWLLVRLSRVNRDPFRCKLMGWSVKHAKQSRVKRIILTAPVLSPSDRDVGLQFNAQQSFDGYQVA
jgi:hypothetical protein